MPQWHRFFFVFCLTFILPAIFLFGITIVPIIAGIKALIAKCGKPKPPKRPTGPQKPDKPIEPRIGASNTEWNQYRQDMENYRKEKRKWKQDMEGFKKGEKEALKVYYEEMKQYKENYGEYAGDTEESGLEYIKETTFHIMFCMKQRPRLLCWFVKKYSNTL